MSCNHYLSSGSLRLTLAAGSAHRLGPTSRIQTCLHVPCRVAHCLNSLLQSQNPSEGKKRCRDYSNGGPAFTCSGEHQQTVTELAWYVDSIKGAAAVKCQVICLYHNSPFQSSGICRIPIDSVSAEVTSSEETEIAAQSCHV